jgi:serine/threonine-protein kinase
MEWLDGKTLKQRIQEAGKLDWKQMAAWLGESAAGLEAAHRQGVVHRDIKSANLYITAANHVKILDFGLAKHLIAADPASLASQMTSAGQLLGTIEYMSPEQACGEEVDHRTDIFSLGVVLFEGLTGTPAFRRDSAPATLHAIVNEPVPDLGLYEVEGAEKIEPILNRLLEKSPNRRYQSAAQVAKDLKDVLRRRRFFGLRTAD